MSMSFANPPLGIYALLYTNQDLLGQINSANDLKDFMDNGMNFDSTGLTGTSTQISTIVSPLSQTITNPVEFSFKVWNNDDTGYMIYDLEDLTVGQTIVTESQNLLSSGYNTYFESRNLETDHYYRWRPKIAITTGSPTQYKYGNWRYLGSSVSSQYEDPENPYTSPYEIFGNLSTTTASYNASNTTGLPSITSMIGTSKLLSLLATKFPTSYIFGIVEIIENLYPSASSSSLNYSYDIKQGFTGATATSGNLTIWNLSETAQYPLIQNIRTILSYGIWITFALYSPFLIMSLF